MPKPAATAGCRGCKPDWLSSECCARLSSDFWCWARWMVSSKVGISHLLQYHDLDTYRLSMAHIFDLTPQTFAAFRGPAIFAMLLFIVGFGRAWSLRRRWKNSAATLTL